MDDVAVFGRVTPHVKRSLVQAAQATGDVVAMTGDGVNDTLALKDADLGIAMGSGTPAARSVAELVLLDDRFATLPGVVAEGRRVIANIERVARLFVTKTAWAAVLAVLTAAVHDELPAPAPPAHRGRRADDRHPGVRAQLPAQPRPGAAGVPARGSCGSRSRPAWSSASPTFAVFAIAQLLARGRRRGVRRERRHADPGDPRPVDPVRVGPAARPGPHAAPRRARRRWPSGRSPFPSSPTSSRSKCLPPTSHSRSPPPLRVAVPAITIGIRAVGPAIGPGPASTLVRSLVPRSLHSVELDERLRRTQPLAAASKLALPPTRGHRPRLFGAAKLPNHDSPNGATDIARPRDERGSKH